MWWHDQCNRPARRESRSHRSEPNRLDRSLSVCAAPLPSIVYPCTLHSPFVCDFQLSIYTALIGKELYKLSFAGEKSSSPFGGHGGGRETTRYNLRPCRQNEIGIVLIPLPG